MRYYEWAPYVPVAERRAKAQKQLEKMKKKGLNVQPVHFVRPQDRRFLLGQGMVRPYGVLQRLRQPSAPWSNLCQKRLGLPSRDP